MTRARAVIEVDQPTTLYNFSELTHAQSYGQCDTEHETPKEQKQTDIRLITCTRITVSTKCDQQIEVLQ